nr:Imm52 family immunity protein [uncultured Caldimonas sp.]
MRTDPLELRATIWPTSTDFLSAEKQYANLWRVAKELEAIGLPLDQWFPPAETEAASLLNRAFDANGPTTAAIALAKALQTNELDSYGAWNGSDGADAAMFKLAVASNFKLFPTRFELSAKKAVAAFDSYENVLRILRLVLELWSPVLAEVKPYRYTQHRAFPDKPGVGWMVYLPFAIKRDQVPEAAEVIPILGDDKKQKGAIVVSTRETFDVQNKAHIKLANDLEIRLVDQDLLPSYMAFRNIR